MGQSNSSLNFNKKIFCKIHVSKEATAFCFTHKTLICMSCIVEKVHFYMDCKVEEMAGMNMQIKECFGMMQEISKAKRTQRVNQREMKMKQEIEDAYTKALDNLEKLRLAHYEVLSEEIANLKEGESETLTKLYKAIDCYKVDGKEKEADELKKEILMENFGCDLVFEKVKPAFTELQKSLAKVKELRTNYKERISHSSQVVGSDFVYE